MLLPRNVAFNKVALKLHLHGPNLEEGLFFPTVASNGKIWM